MIGLWKPAMTASSVSDISRVPSRICCGELQAAAERIPEQAHLDLAAAARLGVALQRAEAAREARLGLRRADAELDRRSSGLGADAPLVPIDEGGGDGALKQVRRLIEPVAVVVVMAMSSL